MTSLLSDPLFFAAAVPAVILIGMSKGGFGGAMALMGVPLMSLVVSPVQAAAILLPILVVMDGVSLWTWRGTFDRTTLRNTLPGGMLGIAIGWATAAIVTVGMVRLIVGIVALLFFLRWLSQKIARSERVRTESAATGTLWAWTWVTAPPPGYDGPVPYGFGVVELPEGLRVITRLVLDPDVAPTVGQPMRAVLDTVGTDPESGHDLVSWAFAPLDASVGL